MTNTKRAWSDVPDHVIVKMPGMEYGMDLGAAADLHDQLGKAILEALKIKPDPFGEWWNLNAFGISGCRRDHAEQIWRAAFKAGQEAVK